MSKKRRVFSPGFRISVVKRILEGESISKLHHELQIKRSVLYRWRDAYRREGEEGLSRAVGRPPGSANGAASSEMSEEDRLRRQVAELERKVGQQALYLDFFERAFKRVKESSQESGNAGAAASTKRSGT